MTALFEECFRPQVLVKRAQALIFQIVQDFDWKLSRSNI